MSGSGWFLRLPTPNASADEAVLTRQYWEQLCRGLPLAARRITGKAALGLAGFLPARSPPRRALPCLGAGGHAPPAPSIPRALHLRPGCGGRKRPSLGGRARQLPASSASGHSRPRRRCGRAQAHAGLPAPLRARPAGEDRGGPCLRAACPAEGTERRRGGPDPAPRPRRAPFPAARWAPLSQSRARPAAHDRVAELCARFGVGVDRGRRFPAPPRARLCARSCRLCRPLGSLRHALY